ncbi:MAG: CopG family ribbon-helix-helix protein [Alphaproteobacteria bacterium]
MTQDATLTLRLTPAVRKRLAALAEKADRSEAQLAGDAIVDFVARETAVVEGIRRGLADAKAGRVTAHADVQARIAATIARAAKRR